MKSMGNTNSNVHSSKGSIKLSEIPARRQIIGDDSDEWTTESEYTASEEEIEEELHIAPKTVHFSNKKDVTAIVHRSPSPSNVSKTQTLKEETKPMNAPQSSSQLFERDDDLFKKYFEAKYLCPSTNVVMQDTTSTKLPDSVLTSDLCESAPPLPHQDISSVLSFESVDVFKKDSELCTVEKIFEDGVDNRSIITAPDYTTHPTPFLQHPELSGSWIDSTLFLKPDVVFSQLTCIVCFGGMTSPLAFPNREIAMKMFSFDGKIWIEAGTLPEPRYDAAACVMGSAIFVTGGCDPCNPGGAALATAWYLCPQKRVWTKLPDMKQPRRRHALVHVGQRIYAIGGQMGDKILKSMECYDPKVGVWEEAPSMTTPRAGAGVATVRNHIWACGGVSDFRNGVANKLTEEVEVFDVTKKMWRPEKHLTMPRAFGDLINIKDKLYLVGGLEVQPNHGLRVVASIVCRCAKTGTWKHWINLKCRRCHAKAVYKDPLLYVVGGEKEIGGSPAGTMETLDIKTGKSSNVSLLPYSLTGFCCLKIQETYK